MPKLITDLHFDLLKQIMFFVGKSPDGAAHLVKALLVCRVFMQVGKNREVLKAVVFDNARLSDQYKSFQLTNGLLNRCAQVGNFEAQYMLAKIILLSSSQLLDLRKESVLCSECAEQEARASSFVTYFTVEQASGGNGLGTTLLHFELVKLFLCQCSLVDLFEMRQHLDDYIELFIGSGKDTYIELTNSINKICEHAAAIQACVWFIRTYDRAGDENELPIPKNDVAKRILEAGRENARVHAGMGAELMEGKSLDLESYIQRCSQLWASITELDKECRKTGMDPETSDLLKVVTTFNSASTFMIVGLKKARMDVILAFDKFFPSKPCMALRD